MPNGWGKIYPTGKDTHPIDTGSWEEDVLGTDVLASGESVNIYFGGNAAGDCSYDIRVRGQGGEEGVLYKIDLCTVSIVRFS